MGGAFNSGILATGAVEGAKFNYEDASEEIMARTRKLEAVCAECGVSLAAAALQFSLAHPAVTTVIPGCKSVPEAERSIETMVSPRPRGGRRLLHACAHLRRMRCPQNVDIPARFWSKLKEQKLLPDGVPTP